MIHIKGVHREELLKSLTRKMAPPLGELSVLALSQLRIHSLTRRRSQSPSYRPHPRFNGSLYGISTSSSKNVPISLPTRCESSSVSIMIRSMSRWRS